jgi:hypothetical protein
MLLLANLVRISPPHPAIYLSDGLLRTRSSLGPKGCGMTYSHDGYTASIKHNWESEKEFWVYTIRRSESGEMLYQGFSKGASAAVETVAQRLKVLGMRKSA